MTSAMLKAKNTKETHFDNVARLDSPEARAAWLDARLRDSPDDVASIAHALGEIARARGMAQVARDAGLSRESLYRSLSANGNPSLSTILKVARALGMRLYLGPA